MNSARTFFFAILRDFIGLRQVEIQIPEQTNVAGFKSILAEKYPVLSRLMNLTLVAVNHDYAMDEVLIPINAEVALFLPV